MYFWVCTVCSLLHCCASSSSVTKRRTKKRGGEGIFWHVSDALERRMPSEISFVKFERMEAVKSATSIFLSVKTESVFWELKAELESFDILTILLFVVKNVTTMQETQSKPWISIFSVICLIWSAQKQVRLVGLLLSLSMNEQKTHIHRQGNVRSYESVTWNTEKSSQICHLDVKFEFFFIT